MLTCTSLSNYPKNLLHGKDRLSNNLPPASGVLVQADQLCHKPKNVALLQKSCKEEQIARFKELYFNRSAELSVSPYDTAWVAMVPSMDSSKQQPQFPKCLNWLLENQQPDGSWSLSPSDPLLIKDSLTSTLASLLALTKWNLASHQLVITKGLDFVMSNIWAATDKHQHSPIGFDIIFPGMIQYARDMGLNLPLNQVDGMLLRRDLDINFLGDTMQLAYVAEGLMESNHWKEVMKHQRTNGSLFNSPATTAAALIHFRDRKCFDYLNSILKEFDNAVPTIYPFDIYTRLWTIDNLKKLGIYRYFKEEMETVLDDVYRSWKAGSEEIFLDTKCCAMGFRLLRQSGYDISSDALARFEDQENFLHSATEYEKDPKSILELFKASKMSILQNELVLEKIYAWTGIYLQQVLLGGGIQDRSLQAEVDFAMKHPHASFERIETRNYIENYNADNISLAKTSYRFQNVDNTALWKFSSQDFNSLQSIHQKELDHLERWVKKYRIDELKFARQRIQLAFFTAASEIFDPEYSDARACWAQNSVLTTIIDDFFDFAGSMEEILNFTALVESWDDHLAIGFKSKEVEILFYALYHTINETADKARVQQGRCIKRHLIDIWITTVRAGLIEAEWAQNQTAPTIYEYLSVAYVTFALMPVVLIPLYFLGCKLSEEVIASKEYNNLFLHLSMIGRVANDRVTVQRELSQGKLNTVSLLVLHGRGAVTMEDAEKEALRLIESHTRALREMVVKEKGSIVPKPCKDAIWSMRKVLNVVYDSSDGFSSPSKLVNAINSIIYEPIVQQ